MLDIIHVDENADVPAGLVSVWPPFKSINFVGAVLRTADEYGIPMGNLCSRLDIHSCLWRHMQQGLANAALSHSLGLYLCTMDIAEELGGLDGCTLTNSPLLY